MKAMLTGFACAALLGLGAWAILGEMGFSSQEVYSSANVRVD